MENSSSLNDLTLIQLLKPKHLFKKQKSNEEDQYQSKTVKNQISEFNFRNWVKSNWYILIFLVILVFIVYTNSFLNDFVSDDRGLITEGNKLLSLHFILTDPLQILHFLLISITYKFCGLTPFCFHSWNIAFHVGNVILVYLLLRLLTRDTIAFYAAILFAVHPLLSESVAWISGGGYLQFTFFFLLSFFLYLVSYKRKKLYLLSLLTFLVGLLFSNRLITLSLIFPAYELILGDLRKNWKRVAPFLMVSFIWSIFYVFQIGGRFESLKETNFVPNNLNNPLIYLPTAFATYLKLIFWPDKLALNHVEVSFQTASQLTLNWLLFLSFILVYIWSLHKNKLAFFGLSIFIIGLLITLTPFHIANIVAERYAYLSSIGIFLLLAIIFSNLTIRYRYFTYVIFLIIVISLSVRTIVRNTDWKDQQSLYQSGINAFPDSAESHVFYGYKYAQNGNFDKAISEFQQAIKLNPWVAESYHNLSDLYRRTGQVDKAISFDQKALSLKPDLWVAYLNLAEAYIAKENLPKALDSINKALGLKPQETILNYEKARIYLKGGYKDKAEETLLLALKENPTDPKLLGLLKELKQ